MTTGRNTGWFVALAMVSLAGVSPLLAQPKPDLLSAGRATEGWSVRDTYPNLKQVKFEMSGSEATPLNSGLVLLSNLLIKNFAVTGGQPKSIIESPYCFYDPQTNVVFSPGALKVRTDEERLLLDGIGFRYEMTNSLLTISNRVHTVIYQSDVSSGKETHAKAQPTHVFSDSLRYAMKAGEAIYRGHIRVEDPRMKLRSELLTAQFPVEGSNTTQIEKIVAEKDVFIDFISERGDTNHASGDRAVYHSIATGKTTNQVMELTGHPRIDMTNGWMTADMFTFDQLQDRIRGIDNYRFHSSANVQFGGSPGTNSPPQETVITSDYFEFETKTGLAGYEGRVRVRNPSLDLDSEKLLARLPPGGSKTNFSQRIVAETNVVINFKDKDGPIHSTSDRAVYTYLQLTNTVLTNEVLQLTGTPVLERTNGWMTADSVTMDRSAGKLRGRGHHHSVIKSAPARPGAPASAISTNALGTSDTEIFSDNAEFRTASSEAFFEGTVRAFDPRFTLSSGTLTVVLPPRDSTNSHPQHLVAEIKVVIDAIDEKGVTNHANADKLIYDFNVTGTTTNEIVQLIGHPVLVQNGMITKVEKSIVYNMVTGQIFPDGAIESNGPISDNKKATPPKTNAPPPPNPVGR